MSNVSFRRGGLFDPMMIDSGQTLTNNLGMFANSLGKPTFSPNDPQAWAAQAARLQSLGDTRGAMDALRMSKSLEDRVNQQKADMQARKDAIAKTSAENDILMAGIKGQEAQRAKDAADVEKLATMAESRFGKETADIIRMLPKDQAIQVIKSSAQGPKRDLKEIKEVDEQGNTVTRIIDLNNNNQDVIEPYVSKRGDVTEKLKSDNKRTAELSAGRSKRLADIQTATDFMNAFGEGASSGAGRAALSWFPGVYTDQGQFDEEFNAFAETAARAALKANGETRPTDADVEGMKRAMFGVGRDEQVNINLLHKFISDQIADENELREARGEDPLPIPKKPEAPGFVEKWTKAKTVGRFTVEELD